MSFIRIIFYLHLRPVATNIIKINTNHAKGYIIVTVIVRFKQNSFDNCFKINILTYL